MSLSRAIEFLIPDAAFVLVGDDYETLVWEGPGDKPSEETLRAAESAADAAFEVSRIHAARQVAYSAESDPLFFEWQRGEGSEQAWLDKVEEIKQRHPLPS